MSRRTRARGPAFRTLRDPRRRQRIARRVRRNRPCPLQGETARGAAPGRLCGPQPRPCGEPGRDRRLPRSRLRSAAGLASTDRGEFRRPGDATGLRQSAAHRRLAAARVADGLRGRQGRAGDRGRRRGRDLRIHLQHGGAPGGLRETGGLRRSQARRRHALRARGGAGVLLPLDPVRPRDGDREPRDGRPPRLLEKGVPLRLSPPPQQPDPPVAAAGKRRAPRDLPGRRPRQALLPGACGAAARGARDRSRLLARGLRRRGVAP